MKDLVPTNKNRLICPMDTFTDTLFFSLVDYRNLQFTSNDPNEIIEFYNGFEDRDELIQWMNERPKGVANIYEIEGDKEIIVVIPTADFNGKYAKECRENIFKGLHMVFVESGGRGDFYFNLAHNYNVGIKKAMEYNPKWIVVSNDDVVKADDAEVLKKQVETIDMERVDVIYCIPSYGYHSTPVKLIFPNRVGMFIYTRRMFKDQYNSISSLVKELKLNLIFTPIDTSNGESPKITKKDWIGINVLTKFLFHRTRIRFVQLGAFGIFSRNFVFKTGGIVFDENFINSCEDMGLSYRILKEGRFTAKIRYNIKPMVGTTMGNNMNRDLRAIISRFYFYSIVSRDLNVRGK
ncbi:MAG: hypothetical protein M1113_04845 [Candidatus Thermoplasmatota archaeon]|nr:hypothetical protein [Candidatus Thermoplasmatota archaeon]